MTMNDNDDLSGRAADADRAVNDLGRLAQYEARTRQPLDLLALATLWLIVVPPGDYGHEVRYIVLAFRIALSAVYGIDIGIRSTPGKPSCSLCAHPSARPRLSRPPAGARDLQHPARPVDVPARAPGPVPDSRRGAGPQRRGHRVPVRAARPRLQHPHPEGRAVVVLCNGHHRRLRRLLPGHRRGADRRVFHHGHRAADAGGGHRAGGIQFRRPGVQPDEACAAGRSGPARGDAGRARPAAGPDRKLADRASSGKLPLAPSTAIDSNSSDHRPAAATGDSA